MSKERDAIVGSFDPERREVLRTAGGVAIVGIAASAMMDVPALAQSAAPNAYRETGIAPRWAPDCKAYSISV